MSPEAFVRTLGKLAAMNLADPDPHPLVEAFFHSHPSINRRLAAAEAWLARHAPEQQADAQHRDER